MVEKNKLTSISALTTLSRTNNLSHMNDILKEYYHLNDLNENKIKIIVKKLQVYYKETDDYDILEE